ncbi:hypothetical protein [Hymenobacter sp. UYCo722]|uniref:hypothetical protein n=1 Tax=Hymenobacter sp. UYCo722 TaxID=3156335 RepID=UPI003396E44D
MTTLSMTSYCGKVIKSKSKYHEVIINLCHLPAGHEGKCDELWFLNHLSVVSQRVAEKIKRDAFFTTGASWKSAVAGPNRILRPVMLLDDEALLKHGINMADMKPHVIRKLRDKAADYQSCIQVAMKLAWLTYQVPGAPQAPEEIQTFLEAHFGAFTPPACCPICLLPLDYALFEQAQRGTALIETCHMDPRSHNAANVGFGHRDCNIAQGTKSLDEFYFWISGIIERANQRV